MTNRPNLPLPDHAYVPGQTARHPDGAFSALCATAVKAKSQAELMRSDAWRVGLAWLDKGYFWEAHELLEPVWAALPQNSPERRLVQALIQIANAGLKTRMDKPKAVRKILEKARSLLSECGAGERQEIMGIDLDAVHARMSRIETQQN